MFAPPSYFKVIFVLSSTITSRISSADNSDHSQLYKEDNHRENPAHMYSPQFNINEKLQRHTRDVVLMKNLPRIDPVKVGYSRNIHIVPGKTHQMKTLGINPPIFEVENFLTDEECQLIIDLAKETGLEESKTVKTAYGYRLSKEKMMELFFSRDSNLDGLLDEYEMEEFFLNIKNLCLADEDTKKILTDLQMDTNKDGMLSIKELVSTFEEKKFNKFHEYLENLETTTPERKVRHSDTVFLKPSVSREFFDSLRYRVVNLTGLPYAMVRAGEDLQVVSYKQTGHYHAHLDSEKLHESLSVDSCCQYQGWASGCTLCRYITILYFLNDVEEGGETAFPIADNVTFDRQAFFSKERYRLDLGRHCHDANVYYKPKKRSALIWYNHKLNEKTGWMGELDVRSYHGGCNVVKGSKWIANNWIDASPDHSRDVDFWVASLFDNDK